MLLRSSYILMTICLIGVGNARADGLLDTIRSLDLNDFALGATFYTSASLYDGIDNFNVVFPAPSTFGNPVTGDETFFIRDGDIGLRRQFSSGWDLGAVVSVQTLGYGSGQSTALAGMSRRDWTIQGGVMAGREIGKFRVDAIAQTDLFGEHNGQEYTIKLARVFDRGNYYFMPQIDVLYQSSELVNHYFGVRPGEALPGRPEYTPGAATTYSASLEWSWKWHRNWFVTAKASIDILPDEIRSSPIVDREIGWSGTLGISYDAASMAAMQSDRPAVVGSGFEFGLGAFLVSSDSRLFLTDGTAVAPVNLETDLNIEDSEVSIPVNVTWRFNPFHRLDFAYFKLARNGARDIAVPVDVGPVTFQAGETVQSSFETTVYKLGYAFSLFHDPQKELSIFGGAHISDISYRSAGVTDSVAADTTAILPVLGADLAVNFTDRLSLDVALQVFVSDVDHYSGNLIDFGVAGNYRLHDRFDIGAGYRFYRQDIDSADESFSGDYRFEYRGPYFYARTRF